jgi:hypothetical protein
MKKNIFNSSTFHCHYSKHNKAENIIIITTDGFRWQEAFKGMDETLARQKFNKADSTYIYKKYWSIDVVNAEKN